MLRTVRFLTIKHKNKNDQTEHIARFKSQKR